MNTATAKPRKLSLFEFGLTCEVLEVEITAAFEGAQRAAKRGDIAEVERLEKVADALTTRLEALIEGQLAATGEKRPEAPALAA